MTYSIRRRHSQTKIVYVIKSDDEELTIDQLITFRDAVTQFIETHQRPDKMKDFVGWAKENSNPKPKESLSTRRAWTTELDGEVYCLVCGGRNPPKYAKGQWVQRAMGNPRSAR